MNQTAIPDHLGASVRRQDAPCPRLCAGEGVLRRTLRGDRAVVAATAIALILIIVAIHRVSARSYVGFHGPTHTAITFSVLRGNIPPTNPLDAGLPLPYYWGYHVLLAGIVKVVNCPPIAVGEWLNLIAIVVLTVAFCSLARTCLGNLRAGVLAVAIALFAMNPLGPLVMLYRVIEGTTSLSLDAFTRSPTHPMLRAMFPTNDVRWAGGFFFFMNSSSRPLALTAGLVTALLTCRAMRAPRPLTCLAIVFAAAFACAMQPIVGTGTVLGLGVGLVYVRWVRRGEDAPNVAILVWIVASLGLGALLALPTYRQLLNGDLVGLPLESSVGALAFKGVCVVGLYALTPLALVAIAMRRGLLRCPELQVLAIAGVTLMLVSWVTHVPGHREHSFFNMGMFMLALPAAAACGWNASAGSGQSVTYKRTLRRTIAVIVPVGLVMIGSFLYRRPIPLETNGILISDPRDTDRAAAYAWIVANTEPDALVVFDVRDGEQSAYYGVESDIPAMTGRFLLVDMIEWFTPKHPEIPERCAIAADIFDGKPLDTAQAALLDRLGKPLYALARSEQEADILAASNGPPLFHAGRFALFRAR